MLETIITKAKDLHMSPKDYMTSPNGLNVPESEAPRLYDSLECLELINSNNDQNVKQGRGAANYRLTGGRKRTRKNCKKNKKTRKQ